MSELLKQFQNAVFVLSPTVLAGAGFVLVWLGLCLWLGGLRWLKILAGLIGAGAGYVGAMYVVGPQTIALVVSAVVVGMIGLFFDKLTIIITGAVLAAIAVNLAIALPTLNRAETWNDLPNPPIAKDGSPDVAESLTTLETYGRYLVEKGRQTILGQGNVGYSAAAIAGLAVLGIGFVIPRGVCSLTCAVLGVPAIATGLLLLLLYKGSKPMDYILEHQTMLGTITLMMIGFGMLVDLALCPSGSKKMSPKKKQTGETK